MGVQTCENIKVPESYFYTIDDNMAEIMLKINNMNNDSKKN
jgi:predicted amidohydrolase